GRGISGQRRRRPTGRAARNGRLARQPCRQPGPDRAPAPGARRFGRAVAAPADRHRARLLRGAVAIGNSRATQRAARYRKDQGPAGDAEAARPAPPRFLRSGIMSPPGDAAVRDLAAAYALGALSPEETRAFEAYLAGSPEARQEVAELRETAALLAVAGPERQPGPELRQRVLDRVRASKLATLPAAPARAPRSRPRIPLLAWAALAALPAIAVGLANRVRVLTSTLATRDSTIAAQQQALSEQGGQLAAREQTLASIFEPGVQLVQLTKQGDPDPRIQLFWDRLRNTAVLHASKMKPTPSGRTYQLWFI